ncbi:hypothetical protein NSU08_23775 [Paenibacillus sp. FSL H7-0331]|uniref:hypothetical protein n=1 Tax=Paenibacillus sp. FSL H7-0331 TaxID=1920421 RepID=UPI0030FABCE7
MAIPYSVSYDGPSKAEKSFFGIQKLGFPASSEVSSTKDQYVFTATRLINLSLVSNNLLRSMDKDAERPILLVNFQESMVSWAFKESLVVEESYYYVLTKDNEVVSTSNRSGSRPVSWSSALM